MDSAWNCTVGAKPGAEQLGKGAGPHCTVLFGPLSLELGAGMCWLGWEGGGAWT